MCDSSVFFFNDTATTEIYTLSLHDALPIYFLGFLVRDLGLELLLERHHQLDGVERVRAQVIDERRLVLDFGFRSEEHTSEFQSPDHLVCRLLLEKKNK